MCLFIIFSLLFGFHFVINFQFINHDSVCRQPVYVIQLSQLQPTCRLMFK